MALVSLWLAGSIIQIFLITRVELGSLGRAFLHDFFGMEPSLIAELGLSEFVAFGKRDPPGYSLSFILFA